MLCVLPVVATLIFFNYRYGIETDVIYHQKGLKQFLGFYAIYFVAFAIPYAIIFYFKKELLTANKSFWILFFVAPAVFAIKVSANGWEYFFRNIFSEVWTKYLVIITDLPFRLFITVIMLWVIKKVWNYDGSFWGITREGFKWQPYAMMLLCMIPLIAFASTQHDFLQAYPKLSNIYFIEQHTSYNWLFQLLYEISYGLDFVTIELFFRGFLVLAFVRFIGPDAILPMAVFYCSIHFGKPLLECISSFFGGFLLGCIAYRTKSVLGGLMVHVGIAWMMELGGYLGN